MDNATSDIGRCRAECKQCIGRCTGKIGHQRDSYHCCGNDHRWFDESPAIPLLKGHRPTRDQTWCEVLKALRLRSTCLRRHTAALIVDVNNRLLSTGYNGVAPGFPHCSEGNPCSPDAVPGSKASGDSGNESTYCQAAHAEQNSLIYLPDPRVAYSMFCTNLPCFTCAKMILQTSIIYICAIEDYPDHRGLELLLQVRGMKVRVGNQVYDRSYQHPWRKKDEEAI